MEGGDAWLWVVVWERGFECGCGCVRARAAGGFEALGDVWLCVCVCVCVRACVRA